MTQEQPIDVKPKPSVANIQAAIDRATSALHISHEAAERVSGIFKVNGLNLFDCAVLIDTAERYLKERK